MREDIKCRVASFLVNRFPDQTRSGKTLAIGNLSVLGPFILTADLLLLLGGEVIGDVECLADLVGRFSLNHISDGLAADVKKGLDIKVVGSL